MPQIRSQWIDGLKVPSVVALDPGGTTGVAILSARGVLVAEHLTGEHHKDLWNLLQDIDPDVVVCESFEFRNKSRDNLELISKEYIGVVKLWYRMHPNAVLSMQTAAMGKGFITDKGPNANEALKKLGWYFPSMKHANDAVRHLVYYLAAKNNYPTLKQTILREGFK